MKAIILAAGEGKRLRPLTDNIPKCMVNLFGVSLLQRQVDIFRKSGIDDISVITGYRSDKINIQSVRYFHNDKYDTTNMVETLFCAKEVMSGSVIVSYGDIVFQKNVLEKLVQSNDDFSIVVDK
ncbi:MAG: phosphocholine cytidylyltransferase family protein, partial [Nitrosopumilaceae archaeon]|nr:phosphocholine cytidylyltransferase family protein [Nitrosopumilaceae archaeon]